MLAKTLSALLTVLLGVGAALLVYWVLNKIAELLPAKWESRVKPYFYILPAYLAIAVYLIYPTILTVINSFKDRFSREWVGTQNYSDLFASAAFRQTLLNTLLWIVIVPAVTVALGLLVAVLADRLSPRSEKLTKTIIFLPMAISMIGAATIWRFVYDAQPKGTGQIGLMNAFIGMFGFDPVAWLQTSTLHLNSLLLMVVLLWAQVGFSMVLLSAAVKGVPVDTIEAARIDGAGERQIFFRVVVPQIKGTIITVFITVTITVMKIFDIVYVMTNGGFNTNVLGNEFWNQLNTNFNYGSASAIVVVLMVAVIPIMIYQVRHFKAEEAAA
ncbi:carbohydrate ABC transporter permease [Nocardioides panaciterrulae]|uniref:Alpha-glucoside transport system permease protein n=1 Tax=Nocardioides panaciterrulae TaxID=661492 RepID=A0A7Y9JD48_9ACTN|nr:sugar ABC transporter permease [Nocardioides panaciterrulae]NYD42924.1 alpha-glucoside transport system permease protein [Nocardioides panaciterrulae]